MSPSAGWAWTWRPGTDFPSSSSSDEPTYLPEWSALPWSSFSSTSGTLHYDGFGRASSKSTWAQHHSKSSSSSSPSLTSLASSFLPPFLISPVRSLISLPLLTTSL